MNPIQSTTHRILLLLAALTLLPMAFGAGLYYSGWRPAATSNHGTLVVPPVRLHVDGVTGKWSLLLVGGTDCGAPCTARLDDLRRVRVALAKEWQRTQHLSLDRVPDGLGSVAAGTVFIVDPDGLAMMRYAPGARLEGIRADLERLLTYSWIG